MKFRSMAGYDCPGSFFPEEETRELPERSVEVAVKQAPENAYAFVLYDLPIPDFDYDEELFTICPKPQNSSARHFIGGKIFTADELRDLAVKEGDVDKYRVLIANVTQSAFGGENGRAIRCRTGNWQPFFPGDVYVADGLKQKGPK